MQLCLYNRSSQAKFLKTDEVDVAFNVTENKINSITDFFFWKYYLHLELLPLYSWKTFSQNFFKKNFLNTLRGSSRRKERSVRFRLPSEQQLCIAENYQKFLFRDALGHKSKVSQKSCCNDLCQVAVLKELVDGTLERDFTKASDVSVWGWFFIKKVHEGVFEDLQLKCTINRDVCKRTCLIGAFIRDLNHFWLGLLGLFF